MFKKIAASLTLAICGVMSGAAAYAHGAHDPDAGKGLKPPPLAVLQLDQTRDVASRYLDVDAAVAAGYVDIGLFVPNMGWHYMKESLVDEKFEWTRPELLVYADDPCGGKRRLVAVEYAVPLALSKKAPGDGPETVPSPSFPYTGK